VSLAWLLFKLPNFADAHAYVVALVQNHRQATNPAFLFLIAVYSAPVLAYHALHLARERGARMAASTSVLLGAMLAAVLLNSGRPSAFIYFQF